MDLLLLDSVLRNLNTSSLASILSLDGLNSVNISGLNSSDVSGCVNIIGIQNTASQGDAASVQLSDLHFSNSSTGAVLLLNNSANIADSTFRNVTQTPGTISFDTADGSPVSITACTFSDLGVKDPESYVGAALYLSSGNVTINNCSFVNCSASRGGAVYTYTNATLSSSWPDTNASVFIMGCMFQGNVAGLGGGGVYLSGDDFTTSVAALIMDTTFVRNNASFGGGVAGIAVTQATVASCLFERNSVAQGLGAGIHFEGTVEGYTNAFLYNSTFVENSIPPINAYDQPSDMVSQYEQCAGAFFRYGKCIAVYGCSFYGNRGSGLCLNDINGLCEDGAFQRFLGSQLTGLQSSASLFDRSTVAGQQGKPFLDNFLGNLSYSVDVRSSGFANNTVPYLVRRFHKKH